ncbi:polar amino acid transport system permease protein [Paenochrobactrum gallinarii]|uniref:Polar amino acid transport system permease protein n=1 Tax=Paenochrobactrum gallinarii TaxID=643673 RepID=A0A841M372_9HYPH|nr:amino acid ABC transporter permease [Paenochrobactrum gallinarii]MBB6262219.1 polar amino acid transport system permease protein [Paenochrobactrum gallinarii]
MNFIELLIEHYALFFEGAWLTISVTLTATVLALFVGLLIALMSEVKAKPLKFFCRIYIEIMRGTPILVVLFLLYYGGPSFGLVLDPVPAGILGLGFYGAAYFAEIFRSGFQAIPQGHIEAGEMLGLSKFQINMRIRLPQMLQIILPAMFVQIVMMFKESALLSIITVNELSKIATQLVNETSSIVEPYIIITLIYWAVIESVAMLGRALEKRFGYGIA